VGADAGHRRAPDAYLLTVEVPRTKPENLDITLEGGVLAVRGERRFQDQSADQHRVERRYRAFRRSTPLPSQAQAERPAPRALHRSASAGKPSQANHTAVQAW
jgi:HSP20 family protein